MPKDTRLQLPEYASFRATVPRKQVIVDNVEVDERGHEWVIYEAGPSTVRCPLVFLPPVSGAADVFYKQILSLSSLGYRVLSIEFPPYWQVEKFCRGLEEVLKLLNLKSVHIFGASLGGYLAQKFAESSPRSGLVASLVLCNAFVSTDIFERQEAAYFYWMLPSVVIKRMILGGFPETSDDPDMVESVDFMVESLDSLSRSQLSSRMTLNCTHGSVKTSKISGIPITIIDVYDDCALTPTARDRVHASYPRAKLASLKSGGNFPYLSRSAEVNTHIRIHLRQFEENDELNALEMSSTRCDEINSSEAPL